jgi:hypothetical protein
LQTAHHHFTHSFEKLVAEKKIFIAMLPQHNAGQTQGATRLDGAGQVKSERYAFASLIAFSRTREIGRRCTY